MKKILLFTAFVGLLCFACKKSETPEQVVKNYYECYFNYDFEKIQEYVTPEKREYYKKIQEVINQNATDLESPKVEITNIQCKYNEDSSVAICNCDIIREDNNNKEVEKSGLTLKRVDDKWLVDMGKETSLDIANLLEEEK